MPTTQFDVFLAHVEGMSELAGSFKEDLRYVAQQWRKAIVDDLLGRDYAGKLAAQQISEISQQLSTQLTQLGYTDLVGEFTTLYQQSQTYAESILAVGRLADPNALLGMTPIPSNLLKQLQAFDYSAFVQEIGPQATRVIARELTMSAISGVKRSETLAVVEQQIGSFVENAGSYADTALRMADRVITMETWAEGGIDRFRYFGPADNHNRPFCQAHVGRIYDLSEIKAMSNGGGGSWSNALRYGGGIRCRHTWSPVVSEPRQWEDGDPSMRYDSIVKEERVRVKANRAAFKKASRQTSSTGLNDQFGWTG